MWCQSEHKKGFYNMGFLADRGGSYTSFDQWELLQASLCIFWQNFVFKSPFLAFWPKQIV